MAGHQRVWPPPSEPAASLHSRGPAPSSGPPDARAPTRTRSRSDSGRPRGSGSHRLHTICRTHRSEREVHEWMKVHKRTAVPRLTCRTRLWGGTVEWPAQICPSEGSRPPGRTRRPSSCPLQKIVHGGHLLWPPFLHPPGSWAADAAAGQTTLPVHKHTQEWDNLRSEVVTVILGQAEWTDSHSGSIPWDRLCATNRLQGRRYAAAGRSSDSWNKQTINITVNNSRVFVSKLQCSALTPWSFEYIQTVGFILNPHY